jgi:hypothetical protein
MNRDREALFRQSWTGAFFRGCAPLVESLSRSWSHSRIGGLLQRLDSGCRSTFDKSRIATLWRTPPSPTTVNDSAILSTLAGMFRDPARPTVGLGLAIALPAALWLDAWTAMSIASVLLILVALGRALPAHLVGITLFSMVLSPKMQAGPLVLRFDDLAVLALAVVALHQLNAKRVRLTGIEGPLLGFMILMWVTTAFGLVRGTVVDPARSLFTLGKLLEYLVAFYGTWIILHPGTEDRSKGDSPALRCAWPGMIAVMLVRSGSSVR